MIDGSNFNDPNTCYFPVFKSLKGSQDTWYIGNLFINYFYLVFDMSPLDERGKDYIQIGVAPANRTGCPSCDKYNPDNTPKDPDDQTQGDNGTVIPTPGGGNSTNPVEPDKPVDPPTPDDKNDTGNTT